jgi:hypothetical protein
MRPSSPAGLYQFSNRKPQGFGQCACDIQHGITQEILIYRPLFDSMRLRLFFQCVQGINHQFACAFRLKRCKNPALFPLNRFERPFQ